MTKKIDELKNDIIKTLQKKLWGWFLVGLAVLGGVTGLSLWGIKCKTEQIVIDRITKQFEEPKIQAILKEVAEKTAKDIIDNRLDPEIQDAKTTVNQKIGLFEADLQQFKDTYESEIERLSSEVEYIKTRNDILKLSDSAFATGEAEPFEEIFNIYNTTEKEDIKMLALSQILRIKSTLANTTRVQISEVSYTDPQTEKKYKNEEIPTNILIQGLKDAENWQYRALIASLLKSRAEKKVPEALLDTIQNDKNLEVRKRAMDSFESVTGFKSKDVINCSPAKQWWEENQVEVNSRLRELQTLENNN